jgi:Spy/CpxP family protein refolding chaperone
MLDPKLLAATAVMLSLSLGTIASTATAQETDKQSGKPETGMMGGRGGGMLGMMGGADPAQMKRMVENCNRMIESMMQDMPATPAAPTTPGPEKKG